MFAAKAGARKVYAVDACPNICNLAKELIKSNNFDDRIEIINKQIEDIEKFDQSIDIIISEWMGKINFVRFIVLFFFISSKVFIFFMKVCWNL